MPLPENLFPINAFHTAYNQCLTFERASEAEVLDQPKGFPSPKLCARLLGHLLRLAPPGTGQGQLQREIASAKDHVMLMHVATVYLQDFIHTFKRCSGPTPAPSEHPSRPSFEDAREYAMAVMEECTIDYRSARALATSRDDKRCMITGLKDYKERSSVIVETAHIIPQSTHKDIGERGKKRAQAVGAWAISSMFTDDNIIEDLAGNRINRLENIISMNSLAHKLFDELYLWLEPVEYRVCVAQDELKLYPPLPEDVTFSTETSLPLPHHEYLALHALCCEVAWVSRVAEYVTDIERRMDDTKVLANDTSSVDLLMTVLSIVEGRV